jgi:hypothetical protein
VELLRVLWLLRVRGAQAAVVGKLEELVLNSIKAAVQASSTAQKHLRSVGGLEVSTLRLDSKPQPLLDSIRDVSTELLNLLYSVSLGAAGQHWLACGPAPSGSWVRGHRVCELGSACMLVSVRTGFDPQHISNAERCR